MLTPEEHEALNSEGLSGLPSIAPLPSLVRSVLLRDTVIITASILLAPIFPILVAARAFIWI